MPGPMVTSHLGSLLRRNRKSHLSCTFPPWFKKHLLVKGSFNRLLKEICNFKEHLLRKLLHRRQAQKQPYSPEAGFTGCTRTCDYRAAAKEIYLSKPLLHRVEK